MDKVHKEKASSVDLLATRALAHRAVHHPFLLTLASGGFEPQSLEVARKFAHWYHGYSSCFPVYLNTVIHSLEKPEHRALLKENLREEKGYIDPHDYDIIKSSGISLKDVENIPHPVLFDRYCDAVDVHKTMRLTVPQQTHEWRTAYAEMLKGGSAAFNVGALGIATENIVSATYTKLLQGFERIEGLGRRELAFFELHCYVDEQHNKDLLAIAEELAAEPGGLDELERGMMAALELREKFWDALYAACSEYSRFSNEELEYTSG